jgi:hypothetical protein
MVCKYCGEADPLKITMSTRMIKGRAVTIDVCFNCYYREKFAAEGENGKALRKTEERIFTQSDFYELFRGTI